MESIKAPSEPANMMSSTNTVINTLASIILEQDIEPMVGLDGTEAHGGEDSMKGSVPDSASLLEAIERLDEPANIFWSAHLKAFWLLHVDLLFKSAIEISMRDVHKAKLNSLQACSPQ